MKVALLAVGLVGCSHVVAVPLTTSEPASAAPAPAAAPPVAPAPVAVPPVADPAVARVAPPDPCVTDRPWVSLVALPVVEGVHPYRVTPHGLEVDEDADLSWKQDLNHDGRDDLQHRFTGGCGNRGECEYAVFVGCADDRYVEVLAPDYHYELAPGTTTTVVDGTTWTDLVRTERTERHILPSRTMHFDGVTYR